MKKLIALFSLVAFFTVSFAQTPAPKAESKKETTEVKAESSKPSCCTKANASCCKNNKDAKACTPEQKAACSKAGATEASSGHSGCNHAKVEEKAHSDAK